MNYYRRYVGDYLKKTLRLTMAGHGAYGCLLDYYYAEESPLPLDMEDVYAIAHAVTDDDRRTVDKVLATHFERKADGYHNERADEEIAVSKQARTNGKKHTGGTGSKTGTATGTGTDELTDTGTGAATGTTSEMGGGSVHPPTTNHQPPSANLQPPAINHDPGSKALAKKRSQREMPPGFVDFWAHYPRKAGKPVAEKAWRTLSPDDDLRVTIMAALEQHKQSRQWSDPQFIPHPSTWLNQRRFDDFVPRETDSIADGNRRAAEDFAAGLT